MTNCVPYSGTEKYIFVSYSHKDTPKVMPVISRLMSEGYRVWFDKGIDPGTEWDENIAEHIKACGYFIAFMSANYLASSNCKDELNFARDLEKDRLLIYLEAVELPSGIAMRVNRLQSIYMYTYDNREDFFIKLFSANNINSCFGSNTYIPKGNNVQQTFTPPQQPGSYTKANPRQTQGNVVVDNGSKPENDKGSEKGVIGAGIFAWAVGVILYLVAVSGNSVKFGDIFWIAGAAFCAMVAREIFKNKKFWKILATIVLAFALFSLILVIIIWITELF